VSVDYDELWGHTWGGMQDVGPVHRHTSRIIVREVRPLAPRSVIDVGCGNGANLEALQRALDMAEVAGVDVSPRALEVARARVRGDFTVMDLEHDAPPARTFDLVLTSQVIEHVQDDDGFLRKLRAMCGRHVFVGTMQGRMRKSEVHIGHLRNYTRSGLEAQMRNAGFEVDKVIEWGFPFYSPIYRTLIEYIGGQTRDIAYNKIDRFIANALFQLYRLNMSSRGDVLMIIGHGV
jgi:SAM-dependent methyltransferase